METSIPTQTNSDRDEKLLLTLKEAAKRLNLSVKTVRRLIDRGQLRVKKVLRIWLIPREEVLRFIRECRPN